jgi:hypothetical protein
VGHVIPGLGVDLDLAFVEDSVTALRDGVDPIFDGEDAGRGCAVGANVDGDQAGVGREKRPEAGPVLVAGTAHGGVDGFDQLAEGGGRGADRDLGRLRVGGLSAKRSY